MESQESLADLFVHLTEDPWRPIVGFSPDLEDANRSLFAASRDDEAAQILGTWLSSHQPCLFGRAAARTSSLAFCILREDDLASDKQVRDKIREARRLWTRRAFEGLQSGFLICLLSERVAWTQPNIHLLQLARRLCALYLLTEIDTDHIYLEEVFLEKPGSARATWRWHAGVNFFAACADQRWWHDHRIPGGLAFSVNSVGHMVKAGIIGRAMSGLSKDLGIDDEESPATRIDSLQTALVLAMKTIASASETVSGTATNLISAGLDSLARRHSAIQLPAVLSGFDPTRYSGHYHTDFTLPSCYFRPEVERPKDLPVHMLDFTYLSDDSVDNPDYVTTGIGLRIRADGGKRSLPHDNRRPRAKRSRAVPETLEISTSPRLTEALRAV